MRSCGGRDVARSVETDTAVREFKNKLQLYGKRATGYRIVLVVQAIRVMRHRSSGNLHASGP